jgi:uncharacterized protein YkwD
VSRLARSAALLTFAALVSGCAGLEDLGVSTDAAPIRPRARAATPAPRPTPAPAEAPAPGGVAPLASRPPPAPAPVPAPAPSGGTSAAAAPRSHAAPPATVSAEDRAIFDEANRVRARAGLRAFRWSEPLQRAARAHSEEQRRFGYMGHGSPDPRRDALPNRIAQAEYGAARQWAEVVAMGYDGPKSVIQGWMDSRGHRKILMDPTLEEAAFSRVGAYYTGNFATPR